MRQIDKEKRTALRIFPVLMALAFAAAGILALAGLSPASAMVALVSLLALLALYYRYVKLPYTRLFVAIREWLDDDLKPLAEPLDPSKTARAVAEMTERERERRQHPTDTPAGFLLSQMNPHFLYNALESIRGKASEDGNSTIADMTLALANYFRYSVSGRSGVVTVEDELKNVRAYFDILIFRFEDRFSLVLDMDSLGGIAEQCIPKLTLQPIVENAVLHGLEKRKGNGSVRIFARSVGDGILLYVSDDGVGMDEGRLRAINAGLKNRWHSGGADSAGRNGGIALANIDRRVRSEFGADYGIRVYSTEGLGTRVEIRLPTLSMDDYRYRQSAMEGGEK